MAELSGDNRRILDLEGCKALVFVICAIHCAIAGIVITSAFPTPSLLTHYSLLPPDSCPLTPFFTFICCIYAAIMVKLQKSKLEKVR